MTDDAVHADRRDPEQPEGAFDLVAAADDLLASARDLSAGRAARTLTPGAGAVLKQTLLAVCAGRQLREHPAPGPTTIHVLRGDVTLHAGHTELRLPADHWASVPEQSHDLVADTDAVVLLTVVMPAAAQS